MGEKEYNYSYEDGRLIRATESDITLSEEIVTAKTVIHTICYYYDSEGQMTRKRIVPANGTAQVIYYETSEDNTAVKFYAGGQYVTSHSKSDEFGRKVFDELQLGTGFVSRQFSYHTGVATEEHIENKKLKSSPTTQLVSHIALSDGRTLSYEYDEEERITKVTETFQGANVSVAEYTYDSLGQLLTETVNGVVVNTMSYDNYGNIVSKNGVAYTYGDEHWKDLLTKYGDKTITYDAQGNPVNYLGHTLTWKKGRQLKKFTKSDGTVIDYTYNANGIRTSKTVNGVKHTYTLDGTKILRETWTKDGVNHSIVPMYDNEDSVCGIQYNGEPYYFQKNLQGDIIAIVDKDANAVARYAYDAWGVCTITEDVSGCNIAEANPYRYRGYYFDVEIEMYYLQSRYYDPSVCRFINADNVEFAVVCSESLKTNLYTYCKNQTPNYEDQDGKDAIWLQASQSVAKLGHTGLVFKRKGKWYYWYWGIDPNAALWGYLVSLAACLLSRQSLIGTLYVVAATTVLASCKLQSVSTGSTLSQTNAKKKANNLYNSKTKFDKTFYISGDFEKSYDHFNKLSKTKDYNLLFKNCMQTTVDGLYKGKFSKNNTQNKLRLVAARAMIVPNFAYNYLDQYF